jgi:hypothetical protein
MIATVAVRDERSLRPLVPLIRPVELETAGIGMQPCSVQGVAMDCPADHVPIAVVQTRLPEGI